MRANCRLWQNPLQTEGSRDAVGEYKLAPEG